MTGSGNIIRMDGVPVPIDLKICGFLQMFYADPANANTVLRITEIVGDHNEYVAGSSRPSRHWTGHEMDIGERSQKVNGVEAGGVAAKIMPWIYNHQTQLAAAHLMPRIVIGPEQSIFDGKDYTQYAINKGKSSPGFFLPGHNNHVHVGF